jgi:hypothetical protein
MWHTIRLVLSLRHLNPRSHRCHHFSPEAQGGRSHYAADDSTGAFPAPFEPTLPQMPPFLPGSARWTVRTKSSQILDGANGGDRVGHRRATAYIDAPLCLEPDDGVGDLYETSLSLEKALRSLSGLPPRQPSLDQVRNGAPLSFARRALGLPGLCIDAYYTDSLFIHMLLTQAPPPSVMKQLHS